MNIQTIAGNLRNIIKDKVKRVNTLNENLLCGDYVDRTETVTTIKFLKINIAELQSILRDLEQYAKQVSNDSWITNPDHMGGALTSEELDPNRGWK